ncbi:ribbon-helix-helix domain-containing protein [Persephonella sp. KM09-Lau-8]|uniref:ribbon-helix-helix domain-containing protein n=1 Tax=Persephonella sp. KM09-Lau-8 TaxID=1158345 RepID=UPI00049504A5|nr:ribbon-helix-helix domain-containing protein [Persephonella sp. KM09-Lau-8]
MAKKKKLINMEKNLARELENVSKILGIPQSELVEKALDFYLDYIDGIIADKVSSGIKEGKIKVKDADEVFKKLGIDV